MNIQIVGLLYDIEAKIVNKTGNHISDKVYFNAISPIPLNENDIFNIQCGLGYHSHGYRLCGLVVTPDISGETSYRYSWYSSACL